MQKLSKPCPRPGCGGEMLGRSTTALFTPTINPRTGDGILYCGRCEQKEYRYKLHGITLQVELRERGRWSCQFSITVVGKESTSVSKGYAKEPCERPADAEAAGLQAAKQWIDGNR
ncbi:MAG: hypothetical protein EPO02_01005 [Nitrospirae bacterium]|nr:MAG: hypothetical protein EPO02_01005 [Nitrospirota bacterium]